MMIINLGFLTRILMVFHIKLTNHRLCNGLYLDVGPVEKWEGSGKNFWSWPKIKWPIHIISCWK